MRDAVLMRAEKRMTIFWYHHFNWSVEPVPMDALGTFTVDTSPTKSKPI